MKNKQEKISGIYSIQNKENGDCYIGSSKNIHHRWLSHKSALRRGISHSRIFQKAWNEYGENSFEFSIVELCNDEDLIIREQFYLDAIRPFYNISPSADSNRGVKGTPESNFKKSLNHARRGKFGKDNKSSKKIYQYNVDGEFLKTWYGANEIEREFGFDSANILTSCKNKKRTCYGFFWSQEFLGEKIESIKVRNRDNTCKRVGCFDDNDNLVKEFKSQKEAYLSCGDTTNPKINYALRHGKKYQNYKWKYL